VVRSLTSLDSGQWTRLAAAVDDVGRAVDFIVLDTATGASDLVLDVIGLADYVVVLVSYEPASVVDAYALIKLVSALAPDKPIGIVVNPARSVEEAAVVFRQVSRAAQRFLQRSVNDDGYVIDDPLVRLSHLSQEPVILSESAGPASQCIRRLASRLAVIRPGLAGPWAVTVPRAPLAPEAPCA
jgi:flagellar biosynthesis protein FlhG